jgi:DNA-binding NarL/FixJ family response regulator
MDGTETEQPVARPIRVGIADDHPIFRFGMRTLLSATPDTTVAGEATTGDEALALADAQAPDVMLMDIHMPGLNGIEATARIRARHPRIAVLVVTMLDDDSVFAAMRAGARGYILKGAEPEETLRAIRAVAHGEAVFGAGVADRLMSYFAHPPVRPAGAAAALPELTEREREVLALIAQGLTNAAIAERLVLSPKTVRNYISDIFGKLQVADRVQAVLRAREAGLGPNG